MKALIGDIERLLGELEDIDYGIPSIFDRYPHLLEPRIVLRPSAIEIEGKPAELVTPFGDDVDLSPAWEIRHELRPLSAEQKEAINELDKKLKKYE